ncbi:sodium channel, type IV, beta, partial [Mus musculus]
QPLSLAWQDHATLALPELSFSLFFPSLETAGIATFPEGCFPRTCHPIPLLLLCPSSMPGLPLLLAPQLWVCLCLRDPCFQMRRPLAFPASFLPSWADSSPSLRLRRSWEKVLTPSLDFWQSRLAHPLSVGLDCALVPRVLVLSPFSFGSHSLN